jgi:hypothetical protein
MRCEGGGGGGCEEAFETHFAFTRARAHAIYGDLWTIVRLRCTPVRFEHYSIS